MKYPYKYLLLCTVASLQCMAMSVRLWCDEELILMEELWALDKLI